LTSAAQRGSVECEFTTASSQYNPAIHASYAWGTEHGQIPHRAGCNLSNLNDLAHIAISINKTPRKSMSYVRVRSVLDVINRS
jgi:hypothetical protein